MSALSIEPTYPTFTDSDGSPLDDGYVWIGAAGSATPIANPQTAYWDAALTQVVTQPVRTRGGYPLNAGAIGRLYVNGDYSILVRNRNGYDLYSAPNATERIGSELVTFLQAGANAVPRTAQSKMRETVSVFDFIPPGTDTANTNCTTYIQDAINSLPVEGGEIVFPAGDYFIGTGLTTGTKKAVKLRGLASMNQPVETSAARITATAAITMLTAGSAGTTTPSGIEIENLSFIGGASVTAGIKILRQNMVRLTRVSVSNLTTGTGIILDGTGDSNTLNQLDGVFVRNCLNGIQANTTAALRLFGGSYVTCNSIASSIGFSGVNVETTYFDGFAVDAAAKHIVLDSTSDRNTGVGVRLEGSVASGVGIEVSGDENFFFGTTFNMVGASAIGADIKAAAENTRLIHSEFVGLVTANRVVDAGSKTVRIDRFANYDMSDIPFGYGTQVTTGASGSDIILANVRKIRAVNAAGTSTASILSLDATDRTTLESPRARTGDGQTLMLFNTANEAGSLTNTMVLLASGATGYTIRWRLPDYQVSASASAGAATLPANPVGFMDIEINGTLRKIPYYA